MVQIGVITEDYLCTVNLVVGQTDPGAMVKGIKFGSNIAAGTSFVAWMTKCDESFNDANK